MASLRVDTAGRRENKTTFPPVEIICWRAVAVGEKLAPQSSKLGIAPLVSSQFAYIRGFSYTTTPSLCFSD